MIKGYLKFGATDAGGFKKGLLMGLSNPKDIIFVSFFPQFIGVCANVNIILRVMWVMLDFVVLLTVHKSFCALANSKIYPVVMILSGFLFLGVAVDGLYVAAENFLLGWLR